MTHNDKPVNGQDNPSFLDLLNQLPPAPPAPEPDAQHCTGRLAWLRAAWKESWEEGGFLYQRWEEVFEVRHSSWHEVANWIKAAALFGGLSLIVLMLDAAGDIADATLKGLSAVPATSGGDGSGLWGTVDHPVRVFLAGQAAHLAVAPAALYAFWQLTGLLGLVGGFFGNAGARIAWLLFGIGTLAMIWSAAPAGGRAAATGLAAPHVGPGQHLRPARPEPAAHRPQPPAAVPVQPRAPPARHAPRPHSGGRRLRGAAAAR
ncbi:hypothetical protein ACTU45_22820 [Streptomyces sp. 24-1644]|uniref:hypothetical protein n=1 Tax=Streptomyces sp. 24-1644 TaxID=3457315 RepID=UPI003FA72CE2